MSVKQEFLFTSSACTTKGFVAIALKADESLSSQFFIPVTDTNQNRTPAGVHLSSVSHKKAMFPSLKISILDVGMKTEIPVYSLEFSYG